MAREELVSSAVTFLQDPSVASSLLDKRRAFLESKNLTAEEIDLAFARAGEDPTAVQHAPAQSNYAYQPQQRPPPSQYGYGYPPYANQWPQQPPPPPKRDWRDWFIMATVTAGASWGLYTLAKRYVVPMIAPPTPPQIEQDKAAVDAEFTKAFALIDQLSTDTAELKKSEQERTEKLDSALEEVDVVIHELKAANKKREEEAVRIGDEIRALRQMIPRSLEEWKSDGDSRLKDLNTELRSLKTLVGNRIGGSTPVPPRPWEVNGSGASTPTGTSSAAAGTGANQESSGASAAPAPGINAPKSDRPIRGFPGSSGRAIPDWQKAPAAASPTVTTEAEEKSEG